ncbi:hypothetical protein PINS_up008828 [Pythium insidiosum]|nr:hypothetical protein PINS_up008828 [Pythium insidiosum]
MSSAAERLPILSQRDPLDLQAAADQQKRLHRRRQLLRLGAAALAALVIVLGVSGVWYARRHNRYEAVMTKFLETNVDFDGVVLVSENDKTLYEHAGGRANEEFDVAMRTDDIFPIGSNAKLFTSVSLYQLQERGLVNLTDPVNDHLTQADFAAFGFPDQTKWCPRLKHAPADSPCETITFVQLLYMGSGIGDSANCDNVDPEYCYNSANDLAYYKGSIAKYVGMFINDPLVFKPDTNYSYANPNFVLLTYMIEKISGQSFSTYLQEHIFDKIGMTNSYFDPYSGGHGIRPRYVEQYAHFYEQPSAEKKPVRLATGTCTPYMNSGAVSGTGGIRSTAQDMQMLYRDLFSDHGRSSKVLTSASIEMILNRRNPVSPDYAQGISVVDVVDGWPQMIQYCGGMKCCTTCNIMFFKDTRTAALINVYSNHVHWGFPTRADFDAFLPTKFIYDASEVSQNLTINTDGGAEELTLGLLAEYQRVE